MECTSGFLAICCVFAYMVFLRATHFILYTNKLYKNTQAKICPKIKNKLAKNNHQAEILILYIDWDVHLLLELAGSSSGAGRVMN